MPSRELPAMTALARREPALLARGSFNDERLVSLGGVAQQMRWSRSARAEVFRAQRN